MAFGWGIVKTVSGDLTQFSTLDFVLWSYRSRHQKPGASPPSRADGGNEVFDRRDRGRGLHAGGPAHISYSAAVSSGTSRVKDAAGFSIA
jgi:hypothetical protein